MKQTRQLVRAVKAQKNVCVDCGEQGVFPCELIDALRDAIDKGLTCGHIVAVLAMASALFDLMSNIENEQIIFDRIRPIIEEMHAMKGQLGNTALDFKEN